MKKVTITPTATNYQKEEKISSCSPTQVVASVFQVDIEFMLKINGQRSRSIVVKMSAPVRGDDNRLKEELISSQYSERNFYTDALHERDEDGDWVIEIIDPKGILSWLGIDVFQTFKTHNSGQTESLRLPAAYPG